MSTREQILSTLREHSKSLQSAVATSGDLYDMPDLSSLRPIVFPDPESRFIETARSVSGAKVLEPRFGEDINDVIRLRAYPDAKSIASSLNYIESNVNPDSVEEVRELMKVDVGVVEGYIGVAENGCIWIPQTMKERAVCFASEYLVILLRRSDIVSNMHEAYRRIEARPEYFEPYKFGTFISGPSKTADIESALVYGAQAARGVTVILI